MGRETNALKHGRRSALIQHYRGCKFCVYRNTCPKYDVKDLRGCSARTEEIVRIRKQVGSVEGRLFEIATGAGVDLEALRKELISKGKNPMESQAYRSGLSLAADLAKFVFSKKYGSKVTHYKGEERFILVESEE